MATKRTYQPKKLHAQKVHGFRKRMATANGRKVLPRRQPDEDDAVDDAADVPVDRLHPARRPVRVLDRPERVFRRAGVVYGQVL